MPRLSEFYGIAIYMYFTDHSPPHFHAIYAGQEAQLSVTDGTLLAGHLPPTAAQLVERWRRAHLEELLANWDRAQQPAPLTRIAPLQ